MNQRDALLIMFEATAELPETPSLRRARRWAEKRLEVLRIRYWRMAARRFQRRKALLRFFQTGWYEAILKHRAGGGRVPPVTRLVKAQDRFDAHLRCRPAKP